MPKSPNTRPIAHHRCAARWFIAVIFLLASYHVDAESLRIVYTSIVGLWAPVADQRIALQEPLAHPDSKQEEFHEDSQPSACAT